MRQATYHFLEQRALNAFELLGHVFSFIKLLKDKRNKVAKEKKTNKRAV